jgi:beta-glucosidase
MFSFVPPLPVCAAGDQFVWATGIEDSFVPQARPGLRSMDQYELTQHYTQWKTDFDLVAETGVQALRWGIPWYKVEPRPGRWDWSWTDAALDYLVNVKRITPILDLMHYGTPLWMDNSFINCSYAERVAEYAAAVADRYKSLVTYFTPLNEPMVNAEYCGLKAEWPPYLTGWDGYVKMAIALARGIVASVGAMRAVHPDMQTIQVEAMWQTDTSLPQLAERVALGNERQFLSLDLTQGRLREGHSLLPWLRQYGVTDHHLAWFEEHAIAYDILGVNFYPWSYRRLGARADGSVFSWVGRTHGGHVAAATAKAHARYGLPVMITETSAIGTLGRRAEWMDDTIAGAFNLRKIGVPVVGYTWFPMFTMINWNYRRGRQPLSRYLLHLGLYDAGFDAQGMLVRGRTELVDQFQTYMAQTPPPIAAATPEMLILGTQPVPPRAIQKPRRVSAAVRARRDANKAEKLRDAASHVTNPEEVCV